MSVQREDTVTVSVDSLNTGDILPPTAEMQPTHLFLRCSEQGQDLLTLSIRIGRIELIVHGLSQCKNALIITIIYTPFKLYHMPQIFLFFRD